MEGDPSDPLFDPLSIFMTPPPNETPKQRSERLEYEKWQRKRNAEIDEMLREEKVREKSCKQVRVLLVGQSESGKSTVLKNFQLSYSPRAFHAERATWTRIIYLNLVRAVNAICASVAAEVASHSQTTTTKARREERRTERTDHTEGEGEEEGVAEAEGDGDGEGDVDESGSPLSPPVEFSNEPDNLSEPLLSHTLSASNNLSTALSTSNATATMNTWSIDEHKLLLYRLKPLIDLESRLQTQLAEPSDAEFFSSTHHGLSSPSNSQLNTSPNPRAQEFFVRSTSSWKRRITRKTLRHLPRSSHDTHRSATSLLEEEERERLKAREVVRELMDCKLDMEALWASQGVREVLGRRKTKLEDSAPYYLDNLSRIVSTDYEPSDEDVVRARLRTVGVQTYPITHERDLGRDVANEWVLYDVGGTRSQRAAWLPFFQHMDAIIFLAPINCFNEKLNEDRKVNRLEDSFHLYRTIVSSKLLKTVQFILFLNKRDLLAQKLQSGIQVKKHVPSYGDRPNECEAVARYFRKKFRDLCQQFSPIPRPFYSYLTTAVDIDSTSVTLSIVRDGILRSNLESADML